MASEFTACFFTDPERDLGRQVPCLGLKDDAQALGVDFALVPKRGSKLLAPWMDHKGVLNIGLWSGLVRRLMSIVISTPGASLPPPFHSTCRVADVLWAPSRPVPFLPQ